MAPIPTGVLVPPALTEANLAKLGLDQEMVRTIAEEAVSRRNSADALMPGCSPGMLAWLYGVRMVRDVAGSAGYLPRDFKNVPIAENRELGYSLAYQSVTFAGRPELEPKAISDKGPAGEELQGSLWDWANYEPTSNEDVPKGLYWIMVSEDGGVEVSSVEIRGGHYLRFLKRILVSGPEGQDPWGLEVDDSPVEVDDDEIDVRVR